MQWHSGDNHHNHYHTSITTTLATALSTTYIIIIIMFLNGFPQSIHVGVCNISCGAAKNTRTSVHPFATQKMDQGLLHLMSRIIVPTEN
jgi:hypothetical protein